MIDSRLHTLFESWAGESCRQVLALGANGSNRRYYRLVGDHHTAIGAYNEDVRENEAFFAYSRAMLERQLPVPELYAVDDDKCIYLQQDLGDTTLYGYLFEKRRQGGGFDAEMLQLYKQVLSDLVRFQTRCRDLDFSKAYPRSDFDRQSIQWDLNYFKYYFLKLAYVPFDEQLLEQDFGRFTDFLLEEHCDYFMYRDFQSRNIMLVPDANDPSSPGRLYYIDYQGGRRGAAQYDVASLLYSAKSDLPEAIRQELLEHYFAEFFKAEGIENDDWRQQQFRDHFYGYVLVRVMQAMGAYGYRGYFERKDYFLQSIPLAINNLRLIVENHPLPISLPHLQQVWHSIISMPTPLVGGTASTVCDTLTVTVESFSFKKGYPQDNSGNGGGFIFDCRALPNPGRYAEYKCYTGKDRPVIEFLQKESAVAQFVDHAEQLVAQSVEKYLERHFTHLMVSFGCTGGQHRSVYCAEQMATFLRSKYPCEVVVVHREQD